MVEVSFRLGWGHCDQEGVRARDLCHVWGLIDAYSVEKIVGIAGHMK